MQKRVTPAMLASYRKYTARCEANGVYPPYGFKKWIRIRTQF